MDVRTIGWMDGWTYGLLNECVIDESVNEWMDGRADVSMDE